MSGRSIVTRRAIVDVVRAAVLDSYGVIGLGEPTLAARFGRAMGFREPGIRVRLRPQFEIEVWLNVAAGLPIGEVARQVDVAIRHALRRALGREPDALTIHVANLRAASTTRSHPAAPEAAVAVAEAAIAAPLPSQTGVVRGACTGAGLLAAFRSAVENLDAHVDEINTLNVYPVPDGDTGSNMAATVRAALEEAEQATDDTAGRVAAAIGFGALMGARGNSGVITSQILRGIADGLEGKRRFNGLDLANALRLGSDAAYKAVVKPVEGTILTVIREAAGAAVAAAEQSNDIESVLAAATAAASGAVRHTPALLPILREAGVVDAGGQGLYRLLEGALATVASGTGPAARTAALPGASTLLAHMDDGFGYETMFLLQPEPGTDLDVEAIRRTLESMGESVLVAGDRRAVKIHVHNEHPGEVIDYGQRHGALSRISVENLDAQAQGVRERRAAEFTGSESAEAATTVAEAGRDQVDATPRDHDPAAPLQPATTAATNGSGSVRLPLAVIAVAAGDGLAAVFESFGCTAVVRGGQSENPSTGELLEAVEAVHADDVLLLPNNPNVQLAAQQVAAMASTRVAIVPTRNAAEGVAALLSLDPTASATDNARTMTDAGRAIQTLQVTAAVRDARMAGRKVKRGQTIVLGPDDGLVAADGDAMVAVLAAIDTLAPGFELLTIYYGSDTDLAATEALSHRILERRPGVDVEIVRGGQPYYPFLIAAE